MRLLVPLLCLAACGGSSFGSIQGSGSFTSNASMAVRDLSEGSIVQGYIVISLSSSTPAFSCIGLDAGFPSSGTIDGILDIFVEKSSALDAGTVAIGDSTAFYGSLPDGTAAGLAFVTLADATKPPSNATQAYTESVSGTLTLTKVGTEWAGSFYGNHDISDRWRVEPPERHVRHQQPLRQGAVSRLTDLLRFGI